MVALFARRVAVYPGDGLGEERAATTVRLNLLGADPRRWRTCAARSQRRSTRRPPGAGARRWRQLLDGKGTARAARLADRVRQGR